MKLSCLLFLLLTASCAEISYAAAFQQTPAGSPANEGSANTAKDRSHEGHLSTTPADGGKRQEKESPSEQQAPGRAGAKNRPRSRANLTAANRPKQLLISRKLSKPVDATNPRDLEKSGDAAKGQNRTANIPLPVRSTSVVRPTVASLNNVRHRGLNLAVVGRSASNTGNTGTLNGTRMHRRP
jgi:hypothetical protein